MTTYEYYLKDSVPHNMPINCKTKSPFTQLSNTIPKVELCGAKLLGKFVH